MTSANQESLGRRIARLRLKHGMTQERLANIANVSAQAVSKWENDQSYPDIMLLPVLAETFDVTVDELLGIRSIDVTAVREEPCAIDTTVEESAAQIPEQGPTTEQEEQAQPEVEPEPEPSTEPAPEPEVTPGAKAADDIDQPAAFLRLRVFRDGRDAVNLTIPLAAARLVANVASYFPERLIDGVDIASLAMSAKNAGKGTLVDVDDGADRVIITLE